MRTLVYFTTLSHTYIITLHMYAIEVEDSYNGPKLEDNINAEFMKDLLKWYKEEKKLHKKYCYKVCNETALGH